MTRRVTGAYLLLADEGKAIAISLWTTAEAAEPGTDDSPRQLRAAWVEEHRAHNNKIDSAIDELERKANGLYAKF